MTHWSSLSVYSGRNLSTPNASSTAITEMKDRFIQGSSSSPHSRITSHTTSTAVSPIWDGSMGACHSTTGLPARRLAGFSQTLSSHSRNGFNPRVSPVRSSVPPSSTLSRRSWSSSNNSSRLALSALVLVPLSRSFLFNNLLNFCPFCKPSERLHPNLHPAICGHPRFRELLHTLVWL